MLLLCRDSAVCLSVHAVPGFPGTWLPNILDHMARWHLVAQLYDLVHRTQLYDIVLCRHMGAQHLLNSLYLPLRSCWTSFIPAVILCDIYLPSIVYSAAICDTLCTSCTWSGSTVYILCQHYLLQYMMSSSMNIVIIWTSVLAHLSVRIFPCFIPCIHDGYVICQYHMWSQLPWLCASSSFQYCYFRSWTVIIRCALRAITLRCPVRPHVIIMVYSSCFPSRTVMMMPSYCIVVPWCCILDLHGHCSTHTVLIILNSDSILTWWCLLRRSWILNTWVITYTDDYIARCLDAVIMISTTTADHGPYIPDLSTTPIIAIRCRGDVLVDVATDVVFLRRSARRRRCRRGDDLLCLCASPAVGLWTSTTLRMGFSSLAPDSPLSSR